MYYQIAILIQSSKEFFLLFREMSGPHLRDRL